MNTLSLALKKANIITDADIERVERQKQIETAICSLHPKLRSIIENIYKENPKIITVSIIDKLSTAYQYPSILLDSDIIAVVGHELIEKIRLDFEKAKSVNDFGKLD